MINFVANKIAGARARARASPLPSSEACGTLPAQLRCVDRRGLDFYRDLP
jgi:hypothetical protein